MDPIVFVGALGAIAGFACLYCAVISASATLRSRRVALAAQGSATLGEGLVGWRMRNGVPPLLPAARRLLRVGKVREATAELTAALGQRGMQTGDEPALSVVLAGLLVVAVLGSLLSGSLIAGLAVAICAVAVSIVAASGARERRLESIREEVPNALESMAACFGSGFTLLQTFQQVSKEIPGRLGEVFARSAHILETGGTANRALSELREGACASELAFVAVALDVQHENGGTLRQVLDAASESVKGELALRRSLRVQTAQAKLSARVVIVMPFILVAAFSFASPGFLTPFFASPAGYALLGLAILMQASGIVLVRRALSVDGVS